LGFALAALAISEPESVTNVVAPNEAERAVLDEEKANPWHALPLASVEVRLRTNSAGLSQEEASARLARFGPNRIQKAHPPSSLLILLHQFRSPLVIILVLAGIITAVTGEYVDTAVIVAVLFLNAMIGFVQEQQAERSVQALMRLIAPRARVVRGGHEREIDSREVVPGDVVLFESGGRVPADVRLAAATALKLDESLLTGESTTITKRIDPVPEDRVLADRATMAYAGTIVTSGRGRGYAVATGDATEVGAIAAQMREEEAVEPPLQRRLASFARVIGIAVTIAAAITFVLGLARGETPTEMFKLAVALAVAAVPEGLPVAVTVALAVGVRRMARRNAVVRRLAAVEALGSATVIGSDKTGTLTENRMTVQQIWTGGRIYLVTDDSPCRGNVTTLDPSVLPVEQQPLFFTLLAGVLTNEAKVEQSEQGIQIQGDPTEAALLIAAERLGMTTEQAREAYPLFAQIPFEPERQYSASVRVWGGEYRIFVKGAPERVLAMSVDMLGEFGLVPLDVDQIRSVTREFGARGLRVLAMAYCSLPRAPREPDAVEEPEDLTFLGLQGMVDPPRAGVHQAIVCCHDAGVRVVMITGDHAATAQAIGKELAVTSDGAAVLTGAQLAELDDHQLRQAAKSTALYARVAPEQKLRVVRALQDEGEIVAVTGDGVNDAPALKAADIGVAMGRGGTDVAREAADIVLTDDNFVSITAAIEEGRITFDNVRKMVFFLLSTNAAEVVVILAALALGWPLPLLATQILWLNLVTDTLQGTPLAFEPGEPDILRRPPRPLREGIVSRLIWERIGLSAVVLAGGTLALFWWELNNGASLTEAQTVALTTLVLFQAFQAGNARSEWRSLFRMSPFANPLLLLGAVAAVLIHAAALYFPPTQFVLRVEPIGLDAWLRIGLTASTILVAVELHKVLRRPSV
jgi:magnesium-transporting ATPase (P-type)